MTQEKDSKDKFHGLRQRVEASLSGKPSDMEELSALSPEEAQRLVHELRVHQIELEMQNEDLRQAQVNLEELKDRYLDLYDFAPVGYVTLNDKGIILEANLTAARLQGEERLTLISRPFSRFVCKEFGDAYYLYLQKVFETRSKQTCEINLARKDGTHFCAQLESMAVQDESGEFSRCRTILWDITDRKKAEEAFRETARLNQTLIDRMPCVALLLRPYSREIVASNEQAVKVGAVPGAQCFITWGQREDPCPWCLAPKLWETGEAQHLEVEALGIVFDAYWIPISSDLYMHYAFDITDRKRAEEALRESEARYKAIVEDQTELICRFLPDLTLTFVNGTYCRYFGKQPEELVGQRFLTLIPDAFHDEVREHFASFSPENPISTQEHEVVSSDGQIGWQEWTNRAIFDGQDNLVGFQSVGKDITERKRAEEGLQTTLHRFYTILSSMYAGVLLVTDEGRVEFANQAFCDLFDLDDLPSDLDGLAVPEMIQKIRDVYVDPAEAVARIQAIVAQKRPVKGEGVAMRGGRTYIRDFIPILIEGKGYGRLWHHHDITDRKKAEEALRESEERFRLAMEATNDGVWDWDLKTDQVFRSPGFFSMLGYGDEEFSGRFGEWQNLVHPEDLKVALQALNEYLNCTTENYEVEFRMFHRSGGTVWILSRGKVVARDENGVPLRMLGTHTDITERKKAEKAFRESEEKYRLIFSKERDAIVLTEVETLRFLDVNESAERLWGYRREELLNMKAPDLSAEPEDSRRTLAAGADPEGVTVPIRWHKKRDGTIFPVEISAGSFIWKGRKVVCSIIRDITDRRMSETLIHIRLALLESAASNSLDELLQKTLDEIGTLTNSPIGFYHFISEDGKTISLQTWSTRTVKEFCQAEGKGRHYPVDQGGVWVDAVRERRPVVHNDYSTLPHRKGMPEGHAAIIRELVVPIMRSDGIVAILGIGNKPTDYTEKDVEVVSYLADVAWEIAERKRAEDALKESDKQYRTLFEDSIDGVYSVLRDGTLTDANPSFCELFGYVRDEMIGKDIRELYLDPADRPGFQKEIEKKGFVKDYEIKFQNRNRTEVDCLVSSSVFFEEDGSIAGYRGIVRDLTARKELHRQLQQAQKMEAVGTLAGGIAHDFNNLLQVVLGYSELVLADEALPRGFRDDMGKVLMAARNGADLVQRLLTFSRKTETKPLDLDLNQRIRQTEKFLERTIPKMVDIELILTDDLDRIHADPTQIDQVLMNLAVNARDAMPEGGKLVIETTNVLIDEDYARSHLEAKPGRYVRLSVSDTGSGMDKETKDHIFEPFYTTKGPGVGTGLGLAMVFGIVKQHRGFIKCYSEVGKGTTFKIYFPAVFAQTQPDQPVVAAMPQGGTETILLVDDEELIRDLGKRILSKAGYTLLTASNGKEALDLYRSNRGNISLVILDFIMPEMDGKQCLRELLKTNPGARVLVASGYSADGPTKEALEGGARGFVSKPFDMGQLLQTVRKVLDET